MRQVATIYLICVSLLNCHGNNHMQGRRPLRFSDVESRHYAAVAHAMTETCLADESRILLQCDFHVPGAPARDLHT